MYTYTHKSSQPVGNVNGNSVSKIYVKRNYNNQNIIKL